LVDSPDSPAYDPVNMNETPAYNRKRIFIASCIALVTTAMAFSIRTDILSAFGLEFDLSHEQQGWINLAGIWGFPVAILLLGPLVDLIGMGRLLGLACVCHIAGILLTVVSPSFGALGYPVLLLAWLVISFANGTVEAVINPLCTTIYPDQKTHKLNVLHAFWPGGLVIGGLTAYFLGEWFGLGWKVKMAFILIAAVAYGLLLIGQKFPLTERAAAGVSGREMFKQALRPGFLVLLLCMCLTAITELGPDQWVGSILTDTVGIKGILFLVYTAGLMFVLRFYAGPIAHRITPFGLLIGSALLAGVGLFWLSFSFTPGLAFAAATVFGVGKAYFWPTMLGVTAERYPRGGSLLLAMMGAIGMFAAGAAGPVMGRIYDKYAIAKMPAQVAEVVVVDGRYSPAAKQNITAGQDLLALKEAERHGGAITLRHVSALPLSLILIFGALFVYHQRRGGYRAIQVREDGG
jgi:MFS family permease